MWAFTDPGQFSTAFAPRSTLNQACLTHCALTTLVSATAQVRQIRHHEAVAEYIVDITTQARPHTLAPCASLQEDISYFGCAELGGSSFPATNCLPNFSRNECGGMRRDGPGMQWVTHPRMSASNPRVPEFETNANTDPEPLNSGGPRGPRRPVRRPVRCVAAEGRQHGGPGCGSAAAGQRSGVAADSHGG